MHMVLSLSGVTTLIYDKYTVFIMLSSGIFSNPTHNHSHRVIPNHKALTPAACL